MVYVEQHVEVHKHVAVVRIKRWDLKRQLTCRVGLILTVHVKRRFNFQEIPGVHAEPYDPSSPLAFLKTFITDKLVENIMNVTNEYADIIINYPAIQARVAGKHRSVFHLWKNSGKDEMWLYFGVCLIMGVVQKPEYHIYWTR